MNHLILHLVNLFFAGMLAGTETTAHYGLGAPPAALSEQSQIQLRQGLVLKLRVLVPAFFVPTLASAIALAILGGGECTGTSVTLSTGHIRYKSPAVVGA